MVRTTTHTLVDDLGGDGGAIALDGDWGRRTVGWEQRGIDGDKHAARDVLLAARGEGTGVALLADGRDIATVAGALVEGGCCYRSGQHDKVGECGSGRDLHLGASGFTLLFVCPIWK